MVIIIRCKDIDTDSRVLKYVTFLRNNNIDYRIISWNRTNNRSFDEYTINYDYNSSYNLGGWKAVKGRIQWMRFVVKTLKSLNVDDSTVIHACDLDAAFPAVFFKKHFKKQIKVIFDIFDWFSATLSNQNRLIVNAFSVMEKYCINNSDCVIICEEERRSQIPYKIDENSLYILPNIPNFNSRDFLIYDEALRFENNNITVSYVGGLYGERCLDELISIAEEGLINLLIAGFGDKKIEERLLNQKLKNIKFFGKVQYEQGLNIMYNSDVIYAMYSKSNPNHLFAAPNKYYESMFLGKPIVSTKGINMERKIMMNNMGYVSDEDINNIKQCLTSLSIEDLRLKGENAYHLWETKYNNYISNFLEKEYKSILKIN